MLRFNLTWRHHSPFASCWRSPLLCAAPCARRHIPINTATQRDPFGHCCIRCLLLPCYSGIPRRWLKLWALPLPGECQFSPTGWSVSVKHYRWYLFLFPLDGRPASSGTVKSDGCPFERRLCFLGLWAINVLTVKHDGCVHALWFLFYIAGGAPWWSLLLLRSLLTLKLLLPHDLRVRFGAPPDRWLQGKSHWLKQNPLVLEWLIHIYIVSNCMQSGKYHKQQTAADTIGIHSILHAS